ncbi:MAG: aminotransferase class I/II-fold pyridoxal phosphate-dependent enzyme [Gammaproteobacteria bacterium]|jgi:8-amino-7-oxononanoate synthase|nr:aminotransferase class I/II-fold pyridoxal phosphate-dependent enzyme [Gammaproteobacteria bacterium]
MPLLDKFESAARIRQNLEAGGHDPTRVVIDQILTPTEGMVEGRRTILAGTNNYLGMTFDPACIEAGKAALESQGTGTTGSRMANGSFAAHAELEQEIANFFQMPHAMVFSTGYAANLGMLTALCSAGDTVLLDADAHASLYDGCQMSGANIFRFRHNDVESLEKRLQRLGDAAQNCLIVVEGMYSVLGDCAPLAEMVELKQRYGACLLVDEAHSLGIFGERGCGIAEQAGVLDQVDFVVGTFSKSLGSMGGFCASPHAQLELVRYVSRPFIFTASSSPATVATTHEALRQLRERPELRDAIWRNANHLYEGLKERGFEVGPQASPVVAVRLGEKEKAVVFWNRLLESGVYTNLMIPPASPDRDSYLRCSVSAAHSDEQIDRIIEAFDNLKSLA